MRPRTVLVLLVVVVALLAFIWAFEGDLPSTDERAELEKRLVRLESEEVSSVEILRGEERVQIERVPVGGGESLEESEWRLTQPLAARADEEQVESLLGALTTLEKKRSLDDVSDADAGLDAPRGRLRLVGDGSEAEVLIGGAIPASDSMIVGVTGQETKYVVDDSIWSALDQAPGAWRSRRVFPGQRDDIDRIVLSRGDQRLEIVKRPEGFWLESPFSDLAGEDPVEELIAGLTGLRVSEFVDELDRSPADYGIEPPVAGIEVVMTHRSEPFRLVWGNAVPADEGRAYASSEGQLFITESDLDDSLQRPVDEWRSRSITSLETYQIDWVSVMQSDAEELRLERAGADWQRNDDKIAFTSVSDFLYAVTDTEARWVSTPIDLQARGPELGEPTLELTLGSGEREESVSVFPTASEGVPVKVHNRQVILWVEAKSIDEILAKLAEVRAAKSKNSAEEDEQDGSAAELSIDEER